MYILQDWQGSSRAIISQSGYVQARMDYTAFGEEIYANVGVRTTAQGFNSNTNLSQKYALTERDKATGLDHTWFRKNENKAGRWTSPDPYNGSMSLGNPQSFNRYSYVESQPTNFVDPSGLLIAVYRCEYPKSRVCDENGSNCGPWEGGEPINCRWEFINIGGGPTSSPQTGGDPGGGGGGNPSLGILRDETEKALKRAECLEDFKDKAIDITVENFWRQSAIAVGFIIAAIITSPTGAGPVIAAIIAVSLSLIQTTVAIGKIWAADRDYQKCLRRIR